MSKREYIKNVTFSCSGASKRKVGVVFFNYTSPSGGATLAQSRMLEHQEEHSRKAKNAPGSAARTNNAQLMLYGALCF